MDYICRMQSAPMTVIETPSFLRDAKRLMDDEERQEVVAFLAHNPDAGDILQGTGGNIPHEVNHERQPHC